MSDAYQPPVTSHDARQRLATVADAVRLAHLPTDDGRCRADGCGWYPCLTYHDGMYAAFLAEDPGATDTQLRAALARLAAVPLPADPARCGHCDAPIEQDAFANWTHTYGGWRCEDADSLATPA